MFKNFLEKATSFKCVLCHKYTTDFFGLHIEYASSRLSSSEESALTFVLQYKFSPDFLKFHTKAANYRLSEELPTSFVIYFTTSLF